MFTKKQKLYIGMVQNFYQKIVRIGQYRRLLILINNVKMNIMQSVRQIWSKALIAKIKFFT